MSRFTRVTRNWAGASSGQTLRRLRSVAAAVALVATVLPGPVSARVLARSASCGTDDPSTFEIEAGTCSRDDRRARTSRPGTPLANFNYIINVDNTKLPERPARAEHGEQQPDRRARATRTARTVTLPDGRYLVSVRSLDHKMWGALLHAAGRRRRQRQPDRARRPDRRRATDNPLPLGKIRVFVFNDNAWTNGAPDTEEAGLGGFQVGLEEQTGSAVTVDYNNDPLCGGVCKTVERRRRRSASSRSTTSGRRRTSSTCTRPTDRATATRTAAGTRPRRSTAASACSPRSRRAPTAPARPASSCGSRRTSAPPTGSASSARRRPSPTPGTGEIIGTARNWVEWAPYTFGTFDDPVENPFVALSDATTDQTVFVGQGDGAGNFDIQNVPAGDYNLAIWDEQLSYIMRFKPVTWPPARRSTSTRPATTAASASASRAGSAGSTATSTRTRTATASTTRASTRRSPNTDMDQRWRDGSIKEATFTDPTGYYEYPTAEGGALGRWIINEQGFARFSAYPGASVHDEHTGAVTPVLRRRSPAVRPTRASRPTRAAAC